MFFLSQVDKGLFTRTLDKQPVKGLESAEEEEGEKKMTGVSDPV